MRPETVLLGVRERRRLIQSRSRTADRPLPGPGGGRAPAHVVLETFGRRAAFVEARLARSVHSLVKSHELTLGAVLMPDHLHWIVARSTELDDTVGRFKVASSRAAWKCGWQGRLWQLSYFDTLLRSREILLWTQRYIQANPVRAGLVRRIGDYPWRHVREGYADSASRRSVALRRRGKDDGM